MISGFTSSCSSYLFECGVSHVLSSSRFYHNLLRDRWNQLHTFFIQISQSLELGWAIVNGVNMELTKKTMTVIELPKNELNDANSVGFPLFEELLKLVAEELNEGKPVLLVPTEN